MTNRWRCACLALLAGICVRAQEADSLPPYQAGTQVSGLLRIWGSAQMAGLVDRWKQGFARHHPAVQFENHLYGAVSAIGGLYTGVADLAVSREIWPEESLAFEQVCGHPPTAVEVATGSFDVPTKSDSLEIFVRKENPLGELTLAQADGIFGAQHRPERMEIRTWGELGLGGEWAHRPIHLYGYNTENAGARFFRDVVLKDSAVWNCSLKGLGNATAPDGSRIDAGRRIIDALAGDPYGIAISNVHYARAEVKALAIAPGEHQRFVAATRESVRSRAYPLARRVYVFLNRVPHQPMDVKLGEFLRYILSRDGQRDVVSEGDYLPLPAAQARQQAASFQ